MKITKFDIFNFKSIKQITIPLEEYGKGKNKSSTTFLVGLNESGKSSILEAINLCQEGFRGKDFDELYHKGSEDVDADTRIQAHIKIDEDFLNKVTIPKDINVNATLLSKIKIKALQKISLLNTKYNFSFYWMAINSDISYHNYIIIGTTERKIESLKEINKIAEEITPENSKSFLKEGQVLLTKKALEEHLRIVLTPLFDERIPKIQLWKPKPEYLINEDIDLEEFKEDTSISIPLKNIFGVFGIVDNEKIKQTIEKALKRKEKKAELQANLSKSITEYVNKVWKEHKINIQVNIDGTLCSVHVEDKDKEHKYYNMKQRSDGFNQFISLILSVSTPTASSELSNSIILLDEPEIHLHPSGVRYMRDEILKIGKSNHVIVSTHSHYMVDVTTPERHYIVTKKEMSSELKQIEESTSMTDDEVLNSAFGIGLFKELLPENIIVVEGGEDKAILSHCLSLFHKNFFYSIKSAGGASKVYGVASILADENIKAFFLFDDDKEGRDEKKNILQNLKESHDRKHVLTIHDVADETPEKSTLEDLLPRSFVKQFFEEEMNHQFNFDDNLPIIIQIKAQDESLKTHKEQLNSKKIKLSETFIENYNTKDKLEHDAPNLVKLVTELVTKILEV